MATLEKIRSKSVLLLVIIGVALLAFIVGDAITNSRNLFGSHTTVAKIGGTKIDIQEYQRKREELNNQLEEARRQNPEQFANFDTQILAQMALDQLIQEKLVLEAANKAGVETSGNLLRYYMIENPQNQEVMNIVRSLNGAGLSVQTPQQAYEVIFNPKRNGLTDAQVAPFQAQWLAAEAKMKDMIKSNIYQRVLAGTVKANDLDKQALYNDYVTTTAIDFAYAPFGALDAKEYPVSSDDLKEMYAEKKGLFKIDEESKDVAFIGVSVAASAADRAAAQKLAQTTVAALRDSAGQLSKQIKKDGVTMTHRSLRASDIPAGVVKDYVLAAAPGEVKLVAENIQGFTVVRNGRRSEAVDSMKVDFVTVANEKLGARVLGALAGGLPIDSLSKKFGADSVMGQAGQWITLYSEQGPTNVLSPEMLDSLRNAGGKFVKLQGGAQGALYAKVVEQKAPKTIYEFDEANYMLGPSLKTVSDERAKLEKFLLANKTAEDFVKNAEKAGFNLQQFTFTQSTPAVPRVQGMNSYYPESRQVVRWVMMDADDNEVSHIYESKNALAPALYAVAVERSYDDYVPVTNPSVNRMLTEQVRAKKAGEKIAARVSKKAQNLASAAKEMGVNTSSMNTVRFAAGSGIADPTVMGKIVGSKADKKVVVVKGDNGVYAFQVTGKGKENFPYTDQIYEQQYYQLVNPNLMEMIKGDKKLKNTIYKFEAGE